MTTESSKTESVNNNDTSEVNNTKVSEPETVINSNTSTVNNTKVPEPETPKKSNGLGGIKKSSSLKLPSLNEIKSGSYQIQKEETKVEEQEQLPSEPFDEFDFNQAWNACVTKVLEKNQRSLNAMINAAKPIVDYENFKATISFHNKIQHDLFLSEKPNFIGLIREKLKNYDFDFEVIVDANEADINPYTNSEKFKVMSAKNPALLQLREKLDLDIN